MAPSFIEKEIVVNPGRKATVEVRVKPLGAIAGVVENVSSDALLKGVRLQLEDANGKIVAETTTGGDGGYRFASLSGGAYLVKLVLPKGYLVQGDAEKFVDVQGAGGARADFQVYRHGSVEGRVLTEDGVPLADTEVSLVDTTGAVLRTVRTDGEGNYAFPDVPVDKYKVRVAVPDSFEV